MKTQSFWDVLYRGEPRRATVNTPLHKDRRWSSHLGSCINKSTINEGQDKSAVNNKKNKNQV